VKLDASSYSLLFTLFFLFYTEIMKNHSFNKSLFIVGTGHYLGAKEEMKIQ
jgi:hypothetical protein